MDATYPILILLQSVLVIFYGLFVDYGTETSGNELTGVSNTISVFYPFYQDVHVMIFVGFGFLMTFLKKYSYGAVGFNFLLASIAIQYSILILSFFHQALAEDEHAEWHKVHLNIEHLITGDFAAGAVLISFGALLGKASAHQLLLMVPLELVFYSLNEAIGVIKFKAVDMGGSMYVHTFGAYFGLAVSIVLTRKEKLADARNKGLFVARYTSDVFAMIGTIFLWIFWPSFNGAMAHGNAQHRVVINTVLSLTNSCITAFFMSAVCRPGHKFDMVDVQNATLAGGVEIGSSADLVIGPFASLIIGGLAGILSVVGYIYVTPFLDRKIGLHDTCGVHNLHGMPGLLGGIAGAISAAAADTQAYGENITVIYSAREWRSAGSQGTFQILAVLVSLGLAISGGIITGLLLRLIREHEGYADDSERWTLEEAEGDHGKVRQLPSEVPFEDAKKKPIKRAQSRVPFDRVNAQQSGTAFKQPAVDIEMPETEGQQSEYQPVPDLASPMAAE